MHQFQKPTLWHLIICYFHSSGMICRRDIQAESSSSNPDVSRFPPDSLRSGNHRKSLEVLAFNLHVKVHVKTSNKSTARCTNARHCLGVCNSCWFQQDGVTVHTTIRARSRPKSRFGEKSSAAWPSTRGRPGVRTCPPGLLVLECGHDRAQKTAPTTTTLVELKETIRFFAQSIDEEVRQVV